MNMNEYVSIYIYMCKLVSICIYMSIILFYVYEDIRCGPHCVYTCMYLRMHVYMYIPIYKIYTHGIYVYTYVYI